LALPDSVEKYERLDKLASDFALSAQVYASVIVSEKHSDEQTISQVNLGGIAGGRSQHFKLCQAMAKFLFIYRFEI